ncbi:MAG TPA: SDR family NAD(P)-dependent oxidoreductase, partial [Pengzhenrongella sp.]
MSVFKGKVAIVTGGGSGLGEAISKELAAKGASVVVSDINLPGAQRVVDEIVAAGGVASAIEADTAHLAAWDKVIAIDLSGVLYGMRYQIPAMLSAGPGCAIVNMASIHGMVAAPGNGAYTAAKHGVVGITKNAAAE